MSNPFLALVPFPVAYFYQFLIRIGFDLEVLFSIDNDIIWLPPTGKFPNVNICLGKEITSTSIEPIEGYEGPFGSYPRPLDICYPEISIPPGEQD